VTHGPRDGGATAWTALVTIGLAALAAAFLAAALATSGCDRRREETPAWTSTPAVGAADTLIERLRPSLTDWLALWHEADPGFALDSLARGERTPFRPAESRPLSEVPARERPDRRIALLSPDSARLLQPDRTFHLLRGRRGPELLREPGSAPAVTDLATGTRHVLFVYGSTQRFDHGFWIDPARFMVWGWTQTGRAPARWCGTLTVYDLAESSQVNYLTHDVDQAARERYEAAWDRWITQRIRRRD
jgi:hypothetical protein